VRGCDEGQPAPAVSVAIHCGLGDAPETIDDPLLQLMGRLRPHFEVIQAVRFAYQGE
jgi:hypothetical protein